MNAIRRRLATTAGKASTRRYASTEHGHHSTASKPEPLGTGFYVLAAGIPLSLGVYAISRPGADGKPAALTKLISGYSDLKDRWATRNLLHANMMEQAAFEKHLFFGDKGSAHVNLKFPEIFNTGSPYNVQAGQGARNMESLVAHYEQLNAEAEAKKAKALAEKEG
ncbi:hypothetical protein M430DRAFT_55983 [Amorphotheca resinae ATCC 22711]|uniref:NADH-ubiquinone oxidoreductase 17.8 kDa subunit n=1 Tax=Amorphotheca resinae ATCC 22711 TaxID=857342 RepID=A0A2T3BA29_AMORE|nr:hypothetical protein M430DRAFT_55983 [Amorphotheca resinae ATCC 22711]PSS25181.1 hypothetical protein M430DRAFT_55983 [Amorphotheca resinae ATCC 22711]